MKKHFIKWGLVFTGILLLVTAAVLGNIVVEKLSDSYGLHSSGKVVVSMTKEAAADNNNLFTASDIRKLKEQPGMEELAAAAESTVPVEGGDKTVTSVVRGVSFNYMDYYALEIIEGNFLSRTEEDEASRVAVVDEELALELFNTRNAVGNKILIYDRTFKIIGVASQDTSVLGVLTDKNEPSVYIPYNVLLELDEEAGVSSLQVKTPKEDLLGMNEDVVSHALAAIGRNASGYIIRDYGIEAFFMKQKSSMAVFIPGLILIVTLGLLLKKSISKLVKIIFSGLKTDYFINIFKTHKRAILSETARAGLLLSGIPAVWFGIRFRLFIPQSYIPDELIDLTYYIDTIKSFILRSNSQLGYLPPVEEQLLTRAQDILDCLFYFGLFAGIPAVIYGLYQLKLRETSMPVLVTACSIMIAAAVLIAVLTAYAAGLPLILNTRGLLVVFAFVYINSILFSKERDEVF